MICDFMLCIMCIYMLNFCYVCAQLHFCMFMSLCMVLHVVRPTYCIICKAYYILVS
jgi:hypothetical protein